MWRQNRPPQPCSLAHPSPDRRLRLLLSVFLNPLTDTIRLQSNEPLCSNTVIGTLAVDGWAVRLHVVQRGGTVRGSSPVPTQASHRCTKCNSRLVHPPTASVGYKLHIIRCSTISTRRSLDLLRSHLYNATTVNFTGYQHYKNYDFTSTIPQYDRGDRRTELP